MKGIAFFLLTCALCFSLTHREWIGQTISRISPEKLVNPYFVTVVDGTVDAGKLVTLIKKFPGVVSIDDQESTKSKSKINELVENLGTDYEVDAKFLELRSLRVMLSPTLSNESLKFVRDQVVKLGSNDHISATEVKFPEVTKVMNSHPFYEFLNSAGDWGVIGVVALFWIISFWLTYDSFRSRSYLIEKFQRKKMVAAKSLAAGIGAVAIGFFLMGLWNGTLGIIDSIVLFMILSVIWTFTLQEWKWKPSL